MSRTQATATLERCERAPWKHPGPPMPVLFIAGVPRSGSTLLDRVIGVHEAFCSTGELQFIWRRSYVENQLCGCGVPFRECAFWNEVSWSAFGVRTAEVDGEGAARLKASIERKRRVPALALRSSTRAEPDLLAYGELLGRLARAILDVSGAQVLVDSSKDPRHGLVLSKLPCFELHVVHLIRDPRAVAYSWTRKRSRPEIHWEAREMWIQPRLMSAARWVSHNFVAELLSRSAASYRRVRYEDFVADPNAVLADIFTPFHGLGASPQRVVAGSLALGTAHTVSGNPFRFTDGRVEIELDDEWRTRMPAAARVSVSAATAALLARYRYPLRTGR
jgi:sulfotransferase family protein